MSIYTVHIAVGESARYLSYSRNSYVSDSTHQPHHPSTCDDATYTCRLLLSSIVLEYSIHTRVGSLAPD